MVDIIDPTDVLEAENKGEDIENKVGDELKAHVETVNDLNSAASTGAAAEVSELQSKISVLNFDILKGSFEVYNISIDPDVLKGVDDDGTEAQKVARQKFLQEVKDPKTTDQNAQKVQKMIKDIGTRAINLISESGKKLGTSTPDETVKTLKDKFGTLITSLDFWKFIVICGAIGVAIWQVEKFLESISGCYQHNGKTEADIQVSCDETYCSCSSISNCKLTECTAANEITYNWKNANLFDALGSLLSGLAKLGGSALDTLTGPIEKIAIFLAIGAGAILVLYIIMKIIENKLEHGGSNETRTVSF